MRKTDLVATAALCALVAGCSQEPAKRSAEDLKTYDVQEEPSSYPRTVPAAPPPPPPLVRNASTEAAVADGAGPNINVSAAPGVAFNYRYAYRLQDARIQAAQEAHAAMCEKLTITRCRLTGMRYTVQGEDDVSATLELKLEPRLARAFGKDASKIVTDAAGMLVDQQISGTDVSPTIDQADRGRAELQDELERVNRELARPGLSNVIRDRLLSEAQSLRAQIRGLGEQKASAEESLATTPMSFYYGSGEAIPGFDDDQPIAQAFARAAYNFRSALGFLIVAVGTLLPWALLIALGFWLLRRFGLFRLTDRRGYAATAAPEGEAPAG